jgi:acyl dehydratase
MHNYITDEVKALIGCESDWEAACDTVERGQIRRHAQAIMDVDPAYWDDSFAATTGAGTVTAPPFFPLHALRVPPGNPDTFTRAATDPDFDGSVRGVMKGLPPVPIPLTGVLNGGNEVEILQYAKVGDRIRIRSKYLDIHQKEGRSGPLVFVLTETVYTNQDGDILIKAVQTRIIR